MRGIHRVFKSHRIWDVETSKVTAKLGGSADSVRSVAVSSDGKIIVSSDGNNIR